MKPGQGIVVDRHSRPRGWAWPVFLLLLALLWGSAALAQPSVPALTARVMDGTGTLNASQVQQIDSRLAAFEASRGTQIAVLLVATTQPEDIASFANRVADSWKIGRRGVGDGLLLVVAVQDRKVRIEVAKTLEGAIPDLAAKRVIDTAIAPRFREGDFAGGIDAGVTQIMALIAGETLPLPAAAPTSGADEQSELAILLFFVLPLAAAVVRRALGALRAALVTGGLTAVLTYLVTSSLLIALGAALIALMTTLLWGSGAMSHRPGRPGGGWAGGAPHGGSWRGGGPGGGGFSSGGGGDFGGGGASGDW